MKIKQDPITKLYCREDGAVLIPPTGRQYKSFHWTFGCEHPSGYRTIRFRGKNYSVHRVVCRAFHGLAPAGRPEVDHTNRIRSDNRPENLHWASRKENQGNKDCVDKSVEKYGVRKCENRQAYNKAYYKANCEEAKAYWASKYAKMKSKGLTFRKGPDGKYGWLPRVHS